MKFKVGDRVKSLINIQLPILYNAQGEITGYYKVGGLVTYAVKFKGDTRPMAMDENELELVG